jgi:hypothetical protein
MGDERICKHQVGDTICGKVAVGYIRIDLPDPLPPGVTRQGITFCEEHAQLFEQGDGPAFIRF